MQDKIWSSITSLNLVTWDKWALWKHFIRLLLRQTKKRSALLSIPNLHVCVLFWFKFQYPAAELFCWPVSKDMNLLWNNSTATFSWVIYHPPALLEPPWTLQCRSFCCNSKTFMFKLVLGVHREVHWQGPWCLSSLPSGHLPHLQRCQDCRGPSPTHLAVSSTCCRRGGDCSVSGPKPAGSKTVFSP